MELKRGGKRKQGSAIVGKWNSEISPLVIIPRPFSFEFPPNVRTFSFGEIFSIISRGGWERESISEFLVFPISRESRRYDPTKPDKSDKPEKLLIRDSGSPLVSRK